MKNNPQPTNHRRQFLRTGLTLGAAGATGLFLRSNQVNAPTLINDSTDAAIQNGLEYLAQSQSRDGAYIDQRRGSSNVAISALAGLALLAGGHAPGRGKYGEAVSQAANYVLSKGYGSKPGYLQNSDGFFSHGAMYQHGFSTLFLAELCGTFPDPQRQQKCRDMLKKAVAVILNAQNREGGWRYEPQPADADISVTVAQLMALRAARNAGIAVDKSKVDQAVEYIKGCRMPDGGFCYQKGRPYSGSAFPRSAAAVVGLFSAGIYKGHKDYGIVDRGLRYLTRFLPGAANMPNIRPDHYYYGHYYAALGMWTAGGRYWNEWFPAIREELLQRTRETPNRIWNDYHGSAYATAMACIILQLPNNYLPIMQK